MRNFDLKKETAIIYLDFPKIENIKFFSSLQNFFYFLSGADEENVTNG